MPFRKISRDIKIAAMRLYDDNILPKASILDYLGISSRTFDRVHALLYAAYVIKKKKVILFDGFHWVYIPIYKVTRMYYYVLV